MLTSLPDCPRCGKRPRRFKGSPRLKGSKKLSPVWYGIKCHACGTMTMRYPRPELAEQAWMIFLRGGGHLKKVKGGTRADKG